MKNILFMKNEFVVSKIEASQDENIPFVYVVFTDPKTVRKEINSNRHLEVLVWLLTRQKI
jgi:hypothetical protein